MSACKEAIMKVRKMACLPAALEAILDAAVRADEQHQGEPVTLPERKPWNGLRPTAENLKGEGWNACLDEIAKLGPLYTRPAQGETVAYLLSPPGCSPALVFAYQIRNPSGCAQPLYTRADPNVRWKAVADEQMKVIAGLREQLAAADHGEVERLRRLVDAKECERQQHLDECTAEVNALRAQLAEAHALLREVRPSCHPKHIAMIDAALSASAEPSAPTCDHAACKSLGEPHPFCEFAQVQDAKL